MKREEGKGQKGQRREEDLKDVLIAMLKTMLLLGRPYGPGYVVRLLRGDQSQYRKDASHLEFETYGELSKWSRQGLRLVMHKAISAGLIQAANPGYSTFSVTEKGLQWLEKPQKWVWPKSEVRMSSFETFVLMKLREFRTTQSHDTHGKPWLIFSDYTMDRLAIEQPQSFKSLLAIPGFNAYKAELYGAAVTGILRDAQNGFEEYRRKQLLRKVRGHKYQFIKRMFSDHRTIAEIGNALSIKSVRIQEFLIDLHRAGEINLKPWIENAVDSKALFKASEYFQKAATPSLKEAFDTLGIDYDTLKLCRLYVSGFSTKEEELAIPADQFQKLIAYIVLYLIKMFDQ